MGTRRRGGSGHGEPPEPPSGGQGPWGEPPKRRRRADPRRQAMSSLDEWIAPQPRRASAGMAAACRPGPIGSMILWAVLGVVLLWLLFTTVHRIAPEERGVVTRFGRYSHTLGPGVSFTLPSPIERVQKIDVENIHEIDLGSASDGDPDADRRPEHHRHRLFGALEHPRPGALPVRARPARRNDPASRGKRDALGGQPVS